MHPTPLRVAVICAFSLVSQNARSDWNSWRGPLDSGSTETGDYPSQLDDSTLVWQAALPGKGCSTPIVLDRMVYLTAPIDGQDALIAIDESGNQQWQAVFSTEVAGKHRNGSGCNASPVTDGKGLFVYFKSGTLAAVNLDGSIRWRTNLVERFGKDERFWDHGTSPVLTSEHVIMARMHAGDSWLAAFDKSTGEIAWKVARNYEVPRESDQCYTTPLVVNIGQREGILVWGTEHMTIHDPGSGKVNWSCANFNPESNKLWPAIATPVVVNDVALICFGRNDRGIPRMFGISLKGQGDVTESNHLWLRDDISSFVPSPVAYKGRFYLVRDKGEVECLEPSTGRTVWSDRFPKHRKAFYASPLIANGTLYAPREDGVLFIASVRNGKFELLGEKDFGQPIIASPVPDENRLFIRGEKDLFCYSKEPANE